ncbi:MAG: hypothetical protein ABIQ74_14190 [Chitinophagales bacterium]
MPYKYFFFFFITASSSLDLSSQSLTFCEKADGFGKAVNQNTVFTIADNGGPVTILFTSPSNLNVTVVNFDVYKIDGGKEIYQSTMKQPLSAQSWVAKQVTFYNDGKYCVYAFDEQDNQLARSEILIRK